MTVTIATLDDLRTVVAELLDDNIRPLVVRPQDAARMLGVSDNTLRRLVKDGHLQPVPHLRPTRYSIRALEQFVSGSTGNDSLSGSVSPLRQRPSPAGGRTGSTDRGDSAPPAA